MTILIYFLLTIHVIVSLLLLLIVLMQRPRSEGLGTAFGSAVTDTLFGSSTGNVLTKITTWLGVIFFSTTICLAWFYSHQKNDAFRKSLIAPTVADAASASSTNSSLANATATAPSTAPATATTPAPAAASQPSTAPAPAKTEPAKTAPASKK